MFSPLSSLSWVWCSFGLSLRLVCRLFLSRMFLGTASGQFPRPAASRLLLSRFLPNNTGPSHKAPARLGSSGLSLLGARKMGQETGEKFMSYLYVKWNSSECGSLADGSVIRA